ncbi:natural cytotoxicity triggering receptor 3 ligand 1 isoform X2 [Elgaria multicarinata webbii]|uniref:natural cytotoxicity triggering receptor 3 ligand 1 isoform X2 n=1 Tax=Elgaria multicarinata webbii TaxID=159646 RepID=UPI002FCD6920
MKRRGVWGGCRCLLLGLLAVCLGGSVFQPAGTLEVKTESQKRAHLHTDVNLACHIPGIPAPDLNTNKTAVTWYLETSGVKTVVYSVISGIHTSHRNGSRLDESKLKEGNAELFLPQIQVNEGGAYTCSVTVTPDKDKGTTFLELVAQPVVNLFPKEVTIERDKEKTVTCAVEKFYPSLIVIHWQKNSKNASDKTVSADYICTGASVKNGDGSFNVTSKLRLQPTSQDDGNIYSCIVEHKSFATHPTLNVTLKVTDPETDSTLIIALCLGLIVVTVVVSGIVFNEYFRTRPPTITPIVGNSDLTHSEETELLCLFSGFRPKPLGITFFLKTGSEKKKIFSWHTTTAGDSEQGIPLIEHSDIFRFSPKLETKKKRTFDISCTIYITSDVKMEKFELLLEVTHDALPHGLHSETKFFKVRALPLLDNICCSTDVPRPDEHLTLSCRIYAFFPETIKVQWYKGDEPFPDSSSEGRPKRGRDSLFFCYSSITFLPQAADSGKRFICKANLQGSQQFKESSWEMKTLVFSPTVSEIKCVPTEPVHGEPITLSCFVKDFYPAECDIYWKKDFKELTHATVMTEEPQQDTTSKLYNRKSQVSFTPEPEDHAVDFIVEIYHYKKTIRRKYQLMLKGSPKVTGIFLEPSDPCYGYTLSLTSEVRDFYPKNITIEWLDGDRCLTDGLVTEGPVEDSNGCFKLSSKLQLKPTALDYEKCISFRVTHSSLKEPITKSTYLKLPAKAPITSAIKEVPGKNGKGICLETFISDFAPREIRVVWYEDWKKIHEDNNPRDIQTGENQLCCFTSSTEITSKASDVAKIISCEIFHPATKSFKVQTFCCYTKSKCLDNL